MMLLEYFIWGAWYVTAGTYMGKVLLSSGTEIGNTYAAFAMATIKLRSIIAVELIVMEIDTFSRGISFSNIHMSSIVEIGTPTLPTSPTESK